MTSSAGRGVASTFKKAPGATLATGGLVGGGAAFGLGRMSKGFSPAQIETMYNAGGALRARAHAANAGKGRGASSGMQNEKSFGQTQREYSTRVYPRGTQNKARSTGYRNEYVAPSGGGKYLASPGRRAVLNPNSDAAYRLNRAKASGARFGANNPANRVAKPKRSMASAKSRVRAKLGMKSY